MKNILFLILSFSCASSFAHQGGELPSSSFEISGYHKLNIEPLLVEEEEIEVSMNASANCEAQMNDLLTIKPRDVDDAVKERYLVRCIELESARIRWILQSGGNF